ncbi:universal stress protein [Occallatibacter riparius]|uniref:Universal stress protein n=1 Tax=Occallatibacter riparius TaxID=1002689 RepID=A0A9J7BUI8_9BACT|nr:universal stress protein [Occallatibacter riparius]UWZ84590.1 universal stress protein [Occallatibacter riparius]
MSRKLFRKWCSPKTTLVVMRSSDDPAQVLTAIRYAEKSGARLLLAKLSPGSTLTDDSRSADGSCSPWVPGRVSIQSDDGRKTLLAEFLARAFLLTDVTPQHLPAVVRTFDIDRVMVTQSRGNQQVAQFGLEESLVSALSVPVCVIGRSVSLSLSPAPPIRRVLLPVTHSPDLELTFNFALEVARAQHAALSVLHVFDGAESTLAAEQRSPLTVRSWLPVSAARSTSLTGPIEISIRRGNAASEILDFNARKPHDLLVLRSLPGRHHGSFPRSSIVRRLYSEMPCPVLVLGNSIEQPRDQASCAAPDIHHRRTRLRAEPLGMEG